VTHPIVSSPCLEHDLTQIIWIQTNSEKKIAWAISLRPKKKNTKDLRERPERVSERTLC